MSGLFYHQQQPQRWAVSLLDQLPENTPKKFICGYVNSANPVSTDLYKSLEQNNEFIDFLQSVVQKNFANDQHVMWVKRVLSYEQRSLNTDKMLSLEVKAGYL